MKKNKFFILGIIIIVLLLFASPFYPEVSANSNDPLISLSYLNEVVDNILDKLTLSNQKQSDELQQLKESLDKANATIEEMQQIVAGGGYPLEILDLYATEALLVQDNRSIVATGTNKILVGNKIIAEAGTEIILRFSSGQTTAITSYMGGLSDVTAGVDIQEGQRIPTNHLLIIPRSDGRGIRITERAIFMIKGPYRVE